MKTFSQPGDLLKFIAPRGTTFDVNTALATSALTKRFADIKNAYTRLIGMRDAAAGDFDDVGGNTAWSAVELEQRRNPLTAQQPLLGFLAQDKERHTELIR